MKKIFEINGKEVEFTDCTAINSNCPEDGRISGVYVHDLTDEFRDGDGVIFNNCSCPDNSETAEAMLKNEYIDTYFATLNTVEREEF